MARKIKFRAWDNLQGKFLFPYPEGFNILGETTCFDLIGQQIKEFTPELTTLERLNDVLITQFTGLKDKNGKEIYEGDICKITNSWTTFNRQIEFIESSFAFNGTNGLFIPNQEYMEVIGNIYENPELIKEK